MKKTNLLENIPEKLPIELIDLLASSEHIRIERIVSYGHDSAKDFWYDQEQNEFILLLKGKAELAFSDPEKTIILTEGDSLIIHAHQRHRVNWTEQKVKTIWLAVYF